MSHASIAALEEALASDSLDGWLTRLPTDAQRAQLRRLLQIDRRLLTQFPGSLASVLLARTLDVPALGELHRAWTHEVERRGHPWIRPLRALKAPDGLLAELHGGTDLPLSGLQRPRFLADDVVELVAIRFHPDTQPPEQRRRDRLRWSWTTGEALLEPDPRADDADESQRYPRIARDERGDPYLIRGPGQPPIDLPGFADGVSHARFSADGSRLFVYGSCDAESSRGFAVVLDPQSLDQVRWIYTDESVSSVHECQQGDLLLLGTLRGLVAWIGAELHPLPLPAGEADLSPSGMFVVTRQDGLRIWSLAELVRGGNPPQPGFLTRFAPDGARLVSGTSLYDGRSGRLIAGLEPTFGEYFSGGPPRPWMYLGTTLLISAFDGLHRLQLWRADRGDPCPAPRPEDPTNNFSFARALGFDRTGERIAVLGRFPAQVALFELPGGRLAHAFTLDKDANGREDCALALSDDGERIAVRLDALLDVRTAAGALLRRLAHPTSGVASGRHWLLDSFDDDARARRPERGPALRFSRDGRRLASFREGDGWRIWELDGEGEAHRVDDAAIEDDAGFGVARPRDWLVEPGTATVFVHRPSGARIALPAAGPWVCNPAAPEILACDSLHVELCG